jgi:hypothetical protein
VRRLALCAAGVAEVCLCAACDSRHESNGRELPGAEDAELQLVMHTIDEITAGGPTAAAAG